MALEKTFAGLQYVLPGAERINVADELQRKAGAKLMPAVPQKPADFGLFGDSHKQTDLIDLLK